MKITLGTTTLAMRDSRPSEDFSSYGLFCPGCGEVWGRIHLREGSWISQRANCPKHPTKEYIGGTFFMGVHFEFLQGYEILREFPLLLAHEFEVHNAWYERFGQGT